MLPSGVPEESSALELVDQLYDAVGELDWTPFLLGLRGLLGTTSVCLLRHRREPFAVAIDAHDGITPDFLRTYRERWMTDNVLIEAGQRKGLLGPGRLACSLEALSKTSWERTEMYNDWYRPQGFYCMWGVSFPVGVGSMGTLSLQFDREVAPSRDQRALLDRLTPHLARAATLYTRLVRAEAAAGALLDAAGRIPQGLCLLDEQGRVRWMSEPAQAIFAAADGLELDAAGRVRAARLADQRELSRIIGCYASSSPSTLTTRGALSIARPSGRQPYQVLVVPPRRRLVGVGEPRAILFVSDPERPVPVVDVDELGQLYGLTPAEARVAARLVSGQSVKQIALALGVSRETVRTQVKQVFAKTGTAGQLALLRRVLSNVSGIE